ncbi:uncharacterized protein BT62DRAFT_1011532 [Guyanagaster necrorhizus]|uniref:Uncharacterized protein n=1 Tax=Guyanagaster necrorhizus TaxID=856835 RepID=A0A9P8AN68_9AGAR|nr:uncharacterized protein BT62DRAFT_1011532 [Guyanagaster necrorhizus MCA 3950]KAG7441514.1 hypothetical protein BT62DRAFT_1011532 [Guyanagaster necrorhizus MCA 3950]
MLNSRFPGSRSYPRVEALLNLQNSENIGRLEFFSPGTFSSLGVGTRCRRIQEELQGQGASAAAMTRPQVTRVAGPGTSEPPAKGKFPRSVKAWPEFMFNAAHSNNISLIAAASSSRKTRSTGKPIPHTDRGSSTIEKIVTPSTIRDLNLSVERHPRTRTLKRRSSNCDNDLHVHNVLASLFSHRKLTTFPHVRVTHACTRTILPASHRFNSPGNALSGVHLRASLSPEFLFLLRST